MGRISHQFEAELASEYLCTLECDSIGQINFDRKVRGC